MTKRCFWCGDDPEYVAYHDTEWGIPVRDDRHLFELLCLEGQQAGLSGLWFCESAPTIERYSTISKLAPSLVSKTKL